MNDSRAMLLYKDGKLVLPDGDGEATRNCVTGELVCICLSVCVEGCAIPIQMRTV